MPSIHRTTESALNFESRAGRCPTPEPDRSARVAGKGFVRVRVTNNGCAISRNPAHEQHRRVGDAAGPASNRNFITGSECAATHTRSHHRLRGGHFANPVNYLSLIVGYVEVHKCVGIPPCNRCHNPRHRTVNGVSRAAVVCRNHTPERCEYNNHRQNRSCRSAPIRHLAPPIDPIISARMNTVGFNRRRRKLSRVFDNPLTYAGSAYRDSGLRPGSFRERPAPYTARRQAQKTTE